MFLLSVGVSRSSVSSVSFDFALVDYAFDVSRDTDVLLEGDNPGTSSSPSCGMRSSLFWKSSPSGTTFGTSELRRLICASLGMVIVL